MKTKGVTLIEQLRNNRFFTLLMSLLPIFLIRLDMVAELRLVFVSVTCLAIGIWIVTGLGLFSGQGRLRPIIYIVTSSCAGWVNWTGCHNSCFAYCNINQVVN